MSRKVRYWILAASVFALALAPSYVRAYRVYGFSDAPAYVPGDRILVNQAAFDIRVPYTEIVILSHADPRAGDVVLFRPPGRGIEVFKRVLGCPGDSIFMRDNHLTINGWPLHYEPPGAASAEPAVRADYLGTVIEDELGSGRRHTITYTPGASDYGSFNPLRVPEDHYFLLGDNRDRSEDSRMYGPVPRRAILGKVAAP